MALASNDPLIPRPHGITIWHQFSHSLPVQGVCKRNSETPSDIPTGLVTSRHLSSNGKGSDRNVAYPYLSLRSVAYRCLSSPIVAYLCCALLIVASRCLSLLIVAYRCLLLLIFACRCLLTVAYRCSSVLVVPSLTRLCTLLYFTLCYLTSPGVTAD